MMILVHSLVFLSLMIMGAGLLVLSLLVFDITQAILLVGYLLLLPIIACIFWPANDSTDPWARQIAVWLLTTLPFVLSLLLNDSTRPRMVVMADAMAAGYVQNVSDLVVTYREMPAGTARFPLRLPTGERATLARNWDYVTSLEEGRKR